MARVYADMTLEFFARQKQQPLIPEGTALKYENLTGYFAQRNYSHFLAVREASW
jgi:hypothetical protein